MSIITLLLDPLQPHWTPGKTPGFLSNLPKTQVFLCMKLFQNAIQLPTVSTLDGNFEDKTNNFLNQRCAHCSFLRCHFFARGRPGCSAESVALDWVWVKGGGKYTKHSLQPIGGYFLFLNYLTLGQKQTDPADCGSCPSILHSDYPPPKSRSYFQLPCYTLAECVDSHKGREKKKKRINARSIQGLYSRMFFLSLVAHHPPLYFWGKCILYINIQLYMKANDWHGLKYCIHFFTLQQPCFSDSHHIKPRLPIGRLCAL